MADFKRGIKAGLAVAGVYLVISVILAAIGREFWYPFSFIYAAGLRISPGLMDSPFVIYSILSYIIRGIVFGAVFAALYDFLPGTTAVKKGVVLSAFLWILGAVWLIYVTLGWPTGGAQISMVAGVTVSLSSLGLALVSIISTLAFGALTSFLWGRFRGKELAEERKGRPVLLVSFILGGVIWVVLAVAFLMGVVIEGAPAIGALGPEFWWTDLLFTLVVFLGLPGWVLTLVGWKKTKVDKSGLRWGVAGGVMMALTSFMLLPGALAITGGVFSGRRPDESVTAEIEQ